MWLLQIFVKMLYTGGNIFYCVVFINVHNLLSVIQRLSYFQFFSIANNAVINNFLNKIFMYFKLLSQGGHSVPHCQKLLYFATLPTLLLPQGSEANNKANKHTNKNHEINKTPKHPPLMIIDKSGILFYLLILCSLKTLIMFSLYDCWTSVFLVCEAAF